MTIQDFLPDLPPLTFVIKAVALITGTVLITLIVRWLTIKRNKK